MGTETRKKTIIVEMIIVYLLLMLLVYFSSPIVSLGGTRSAKMALRVFVYIVIAAVPIVTLRIRKIPISVLGFQKKKIGKQLVVALMMFAVTISAAVVIPLILGVDKSMIFSYKSPSVQVLVYYVLFDLICVGFGEEIAFRGYMYSRIKSLTAAAWLPMVLTAVLFGLWHYPSTQSFINVAATTLIGLFYGYCKWKIKDCSLLSLSIAHGLNDATIILLSYFVL